MNSSHPFAEVNGFGQSPPVNSERRTIPFDYAFRYELEGKRDKVHNKAVTVSIEATFTAVSIGYGVVPKVDPIKFALAPEPILQRRQSEPFLTMDFGFVVTALQEALKEQPPNQSLLILPLGPRTAAALRDGIKLNPQFAEQILTAFGAGAFDTKVLAEAFQTVAAPADRIQFLYAIFDEGSGREFQNEAILNIAGLGASDGGRPFRYFAKPIVFAPQATIRLQVTEVSEFTGELHVSLQGYKTLGTPGSPTGPRQSRRTGRIRR